MKGKKEMERKKWKEKNGKKDRKKNGEKAAIFNQFSIAPPSRIAPIPNFIQNG